MRFGHFSRRVLERLLRALPTEPVLPPTVVPETTPLAFRAGAFPQSRLNLVVPSINPEHYFGGIHTAVQVFRELAAHFPALRIIASDSRPRAEASARFPDFVVGELGDDPVHPRQLVAANDRYGRSLAVSPGDVFLATAWWTAALAQQAAAFRDGHRAPGAIAYLIQDFEPGFYPWSSRHALALASYRPKRDFAIFNTGLLQRYFVQQGLDYGDRCVAFEPTLNAGLRAALDAQVRSPTRRERTILFYARPGTPRNAFELGCEALREWRARFPGAPAWRVLGLGELDSSIDLGGVVVEGLGKLDIAAYADRLSTAAVGLGLMISPHPSYPPFEMAAFGIRTVTNGFANKDLAPTGEALLSAASPSPAALATLLARACAEAEAADFAPCAPATSVPRGFLEGGDSLLHDARGIADWLKAAQ
ncbi:MAG: hypothetical protein ACRC2H_08945 [Silanimonas sp.]